MTCAEIKSQSSTNRGTQGPPSSPMVLTTACLFGSINMQTLSPLPDSKIPEDRDSPIGLCCSFPVPAWYGQHVWGKVKNNTGSSLQRASGRLWLQHLSPGNYKGSFGSVCILGHRSPPSHTPMGFCSEAGSLLRKDSPFHAAQPFFGTPHMKGSYEDSMK